MTKQKNFKSFYRKGTCGFTHWHSAWGNEGRTKIEEREDTIYEAKFVYENMCSQSVLEGCRNSDYADWLDYVNSTEQQKKQINQSGKSGEEKVKQKKGLDESKVDLNEGSYNKLFQKIKDIEVNIQKTIPEKTKDMKKIMEEIEKKNEEITANMDDKLDKLQDEHNNLAQQYKKKMEEGNKVAANLIAVKMKEVGDKMDEIVEVKEKFTNGQWVKDYLEGQKEEKNKWFLQKLDWKSPYTYGKLSLGVAILVAVIILVIWIVRKIMAVFTSK
jgi:hypothetical protein